MKRSFNKMTASFTCCISVGQSWGSCCWLEITHFFNSVQPNSIRFSSCCRVHYLFDEVELGKMLRVHIRSPTKTHQVPRGADPQKPQWDPDQQCLLQTQREVWVFSVQIRCILRTTHTQTHVCKAIFMRSFQ